MSDQKSGGDHRQHAICKKIEYHYEEELVLGDYTFAPDFKIAVKSQRKCKLLEHFGLIGDEDYRDTCMWKIRTYLEFGYRPYEDILFTYDDKDGISIHWISTKSSSHFADKELDIRSPNCGCRLTSTGSDRFGQPLDAFC